jgi:hypothetical protein
MTDRPLANVPVTFHWDGEAMYPHQRFRQLCDRQFVVGEHYRLVEEQVRSRETHNHFFASIQEAWENLPEDQAERFPSPEHLRKFALIKAGYADQRQFVASSKAEALRLAAFMKGFDDYALVTVAGTVVNVFTAQSQSMKAMGKKAFQDSKQACLDIASGMIGVAPETLSRNAREAA